MTNDKTIYLVSFEYFPVQHGGLSRYASEFINRLTQHPDYEAIIAVPWDSKMQFDKHINPIQLRLFSIKHLAYIEFAWRLFVTHVLRHKNSTYVFFSTFSYLFAPFYPRRFFLFVTNTLHRVYITDYPDESWRGKVLRKTIYYVLSLYEHFLASRAIAVLAISPSTVDDVAVQYKISKTDILLVSCGWSSTLFPKIKKANKIFNFKLISVARFVPRKNLIDLIRIMDVLVKRDQRFTLQLVGGGGSKRYFEIINKLIEKNDLVQNIFIHQNVSDQTLNRLYQQSSLFVSTSLVEGFGLVLLEAMSKGLPIVAYDIVGVRDIVINKHNGFLIKPYNYQQLVNGIISLNEDRKTFQKMSGNAIKRVDYFDWNKSAVDLRKIIGSNL